MAGLSNLKRVLGSSLHRGGTGNLAADSDIAFRGFGFLNVRAFSSVEVVETGNWQTQDEVKLHKVRCLLSEYGFTTDQITRVYKYSPSKFRTAETLSPKLAFFRSILGPNDDVARVVAANPQMLCYSLENKLMPNYQFVKSILGRDELVAKSIRRSSSLLYMDVQKNLAVKVSFLRESGLPCSSIAKLMEHSPRVLAMSSFSKLEESVKKAMNLGFDPSNPVFVSAIRAICQINGSIWDRKVELYRKWGWSNDDFLSAFKKHPFIMCISEEKINKGMDVFLNIFGFRSSDIVKYSYLMLLSVEERIVPRCSVIALLVSKGFLDDSPSTYAKALCAREEIFVERFVDKYPEHVLELWQKVRRKAVV
ncbi:PREDICTED: transcription termination factor MTERF9, chloroplastic-like [Tarenaya hassleriana]|uniref:transcription termination factor MTERF9, chloroplastic-like n=1 Tax=Tarenaya hassleriana TaxID=28532 RepID=UPI00053C2E89|nr:PREDICTED: transcription termination factor MTERF9, chloroplastic-like [Tarenaya hassleriana]